MFRFKSFRNIRLIFTNIIAMLFFFVVGFVGVFGLTLADSYQETLSKNIVYNEQTAYFGIFFGILIFIFANLILFEYKNLLNIIIGVSLLVLFVIVNLLTKSNFIQTGFINGWIYQFSKSYINLGIFYISFLIIFFLQFIHIFWIKYKK